MRVKPRILPGLRAIGAATSLLFLFTGCGRDGGGKNARAAAGPEALGLAGAGFLVWERAGDSGWEIWTKQLDGSGERRLIEPKDGKDDFCPHVSPDGNRLAYMTYPEGTTPYDEGAVGSLHLLEIAAGKTRLLVPKARSYQEDRAVVWLNTESLCYITGDGFTESIDIGSGDVRRLTRKPHKDRGWLFNPTLTWATTGTPEFAPYHPAELAVEKRNSHGGCQPYFTQDGQWGFWMGGAGGPLARIHLPSGQISSVLTKKDERLPAARRYVYFPMYSPCQNALAFAASPGDHDHFSADYDIFVARTDPHTLEMIGPVARFTEFEGNDRFPDLFLEPLPLGRHTGEAPLEVTFTAPEGDWEWRFGADLGTTAGSKKMTYTYAEPGAYLVTATRKTSENEEETRHGYVQVLPPQSPRVESVRLVSPRELRLVFDQAISADQAEVRFLSHREIASTRRGPDERSLEVTLADDLDHEDRLFLRGLTDTAQPPNVMPTAGLVIQTGVWPADDRGLVFVWENGAPGSRTRLADDTDCVVEASGLAFFDHRWAMTFEGGHFLAPDAGARISEACRASNAITIEALFTPAGRTEELTPIISLSNGPDARNFTIAQQSGTLWIVMRTPENGLNGEKTEARQLSRLQSGQPHHLILTYRMGEITIFIDGEQIWTRPRIQGDFSNWEPMELVFGDEIGGGFSWRGSLEKIAIYDRILDAAEVAQNVDAARLIAARTPEPETWTVRAQLKQKSPAKSLEEITPYREALVAYEWTILEKPEAAPIPESVSVFHRAMIDGKDLAIINTPEGTEATLRLQRLDANPQLTPLASSDELDNLDLEPFFDVTGRAGR